MGPHLLSLRSVLGGGGIGPPMKISAIPFFWNRFERVPVPGEQELHLLLLGGSLKIKNVLILILSTCSFYFHHLISSLINLGRKIFSSSINFAI